MNPQDLAKVKAAAQYAVVLPKEKAWNLYARLALQRRADV